MTNEEKLIVERLKRTYDDVEELQKEYNQIAEVALVREKEVLGLKALCARAADALEYGAVDEFLDKELIAELRKAAG